MSIHLRQNAETLIRDAAGHQPAWNVSRDRSDRIDAFFGFRIRRPSDIPRRTVLRVRERAADPAA